MNNFNIFTSLIKFQQNKNFPVYIGMIYAMITLVIFKFSAFLISPIFFLALELAFFVFYIVFIEILKESVKLIKVKNIKINPLILFLVFSFSNNFSIKHILGYYLLSVLAYTVLFYFHYSIIIVILLFAILSFCYYKIYKSYQVYVMKKMLFGVA